jgi:hypothetical protein
MAARTGSEVLPFVLPAVAQAISERKAIGNRTTEMLRTT